MTWLHMQFVLIFITPCVQPSTMADLPAEVFADTRPCWCNMNISRNLKPNSLQKPRLPTSLQETQFMDVSLDEHDVNAFQVYVNEDPYLLCTVMTHTRHSTTKVKLQIPSTTTVWTAKLSGRYPSTFQTVQIRICGFFQQSSGDCQKSLKSLFGSFGTQNSRQRCLEPHFQYEFSILAS